MDKRERANQADRLLRDDTLREALNAVYTACKDTMLSQASDEAAVLEARKEYLALQKVEKRLRSYIADGRIAEKRDRDRGHDRP